MDLAKVGVRVDAEGLNEFVHGMNEAAEEFNSFAGKAERAGETLKSKFTEPILDFGKESFFAASSAAEAVSKLGVLFGDNAHLVEEFASTASDSIGLSAATARDAAGSFGNLFVTMGVGAGDLGFDIGKLAGDISGLSPAMLNAMDPTVALTESMTALAGDLTSFSDIPIDQSLAAIQSGLIGEFEPLRKFGVLLDADTIKQKAIELGLIGVNDELTNQAKVAATTALILEQTANAHGDVAETADSAANSYRRLQNKMEDFKEKIGVEILPIGSKLIEWGLKFVDVLNSLSPHVLQLIVIFGGIVAVVGPALLMLAKFIEAFKVVQGLFAVGEAVEGGAAVGPFAALLGPLGLVILALVALGVAYKTNFLGFRDVVNSVGHAVADSFGRINKFIGETIDYFQMLRKIGFDPITAGFYALEVAMQRLGFDRLANMFAILGNKAEPIVRIIRLFVEGLTKLGDGGDRTHKILNQLPEPLQKLFLVIARVRQLVVTFTDTWTKFGALAAFKTLPRSIELIGRSFANLIESITGFTHFADALKQTFEDIGDLIGDVVDLIDDLVHGRWKETWNDFVNIVKDIGSLALDYFKTSLGLWRDLIGLIADIFKAIDWGQVGSILLDGLKLAFQYSFLLIPTLLFDLFKAVDWGALGSAIGDVSTILFNKGKDILSGLLTGAKNYLTSTIIPWILTIGSQLLAATPDLLRTLLQKGVDLLTGFYNGARDFITNTVIPFFRDLLVTVLGELPGVTEFLGSLVHIGESIIKGFYNTAFKFWDDHVKPFFANFIERIKNNLPAITDFVKSLHNIATSILDGMRSKLDDVFGASGGVKDFFKYILKFVLDALPSSEAIKKILDGIASGILGGLRSKLDTVFSAAGGVAEFFSTIIDSIKKLLPDDFSGLLDKFSQLWDALHPIQTVLEGIGKAASAVKGFFGAFIPGGNGSDNNDTGGSSSSGGTSTTTTPVSQTSNLTVIFSGTVALNDIQTWVANVILALAPLTAIFNFGGNTSNTAVPVGGGAVIGGAGKITPKTFDGSGFLTKVETWVTDVSAQVTNTANGLTKYFVLPQSGGGSAGRGSSTINPYSFSGTIFLKAVTDWVNDVSTENKRMNLEVTSHVKALLANVQIQFGAIKTEASNKAFETKNAVENEFIGMRDNVSALAASLRAKVAGNDKGNGEFSMMKADVITLVKSLGNAIGGEIWGTYIHGPVTRKAFETRNAIVNEFIGMRNDVSSILRNFGTGIHTIISNWASSARSGGYSVGFAIGDGIYWGMNAWIDAIASKAASLVHTAVNSANNAAGNPHSPAPVTIPLGRSLAQGVEFGMGLEFGNVSNKFAGLIDGAIGQSLNTSSNVNGTLSGGSGGVNNYFILTSDELIKLQQGAEAGLGLNDSLFKESNLRLQGTGGL